MRSDGMVPNEFWTYAGDETVLCLEFVYRHHITMAVHDNTWLRYNEIYEAIRQVPLYRLYYTDNNEATTLLFFVCSFPANNTTNAMSLFPPFITTLIPFQLRSARPCLLSIGHIKLVSWSSLVRSSR